MENKIIIGEKTQFIPKYFAIYPMNAGAIIKTLDGQPFLYGKDDYKNPSLLMKRAENLND